MLTGSTSGLRSLPALSSQLPCKFLRSSTLFSKGHLAAFSPLLHSRTFSASCHPRSVLEERNGPGSSNVRCTDSHRVLSTLLRPSRPAIPSRIPAPSPDENSVYHVTGVDSLSDTQGRQRRGCVLRTKESRGSSGHTQRKSPAQRRRTLLWVMLTAKAPDRAWAAYEELLAHRVAIPCHLLHRLARLLASIKPRTRAIHLRLLSVLKALERNHGRLRLWEWNTLIDSAGKQWHKTRLEDYENSLDIFNKRGVLPVENTTSAREVVNVEADASVTKQNPDIWTYNILLSIAARSNLSLAVRHASSLLLASGLTPNRYTHLCLLRYLAFRNDLPSIRSTLCKMKEQGLKVGLDGVNACLWACARSGRFDVALPIYRALRSNVKPSPNLGEHDIEEDARYIRDTIGLDIVDGPEPDEITYTTMIQALAYHGDLRSSLSVFVDMLSTPNREPATPRDGTTATHVCYKPSMAAFRGLFLGFARHGRDPDDRAVQAESITKLFPSSQATWDRDSLETVFAAFLKLPRLPKPTDTVIYWILVAFDKTSGNDCAKLRDVWTKLEAKYGGGWGGRLEEIRRSIFP